MKVHPSHPHGLRVYPSHYRLAVRHADLLVTPAIPPAGYVPGARAVERMIAAGERATQRALAAFGEGAAA